MRTLPSLIVAVALCALAACKRGDPPGTERPSEAWLSGSIPPRVLDGMPKKGGTLVVRLPSEPPMLNRLHDAGQDGWLVRITLGQVVEPLLELDRESGASYRLRPVLAERWEVSEDGLRTTFFLRKGVRFHDGQPFSSKDVAAVLDAVRDPKNPTASMRGHIEDLERYHTPDAHTVVLHWKAPSPVGTRNFATYFPMVPASALQGDFDALAINRAPLGTGPFRFEKWESGRGIRFTRNEDYWGRKAHLDRVEFKLVKDHTVATQMFERGEFDLMTFILPSVWRALEKPEAKNAWAHRGYHRIRYTENAYNWIGWNQQRPQFADVRVRRALSHLVPLDLIHRTIYLELEPPTTCPFYVLGPHCDPELQARESPQRLRYDRARAQALLAEAGWSDTDGDGFLDKDGQPLRFTFLVSAHSVNLNKLAPLLQEEMGKVGIGLDIERVEWAVFTQRLRQQQFDMVSLGWTSLDVETDVFHNFHSSQAAGGGNYVSYSDPELDELLVQSRRTFDEQARVELNRKIHRIVYRDQVYTFLGVRSALDAVKTRVRGIRPSINWYRLADLWLEPEGAGQ